MTASALSKRRPHVLGDLIAGFPILSTTGPTTVVVDHFGHDSREVEAGGLFVATKGTAWDGHQFIAAALEAGALAVIAESAAPAGTTATWIQVAEGAGMAALAHVAAEWFGHPGRAVKVLATTGTNGKTTTTYLLLHVLTFAGERAGLISTVEIRVGDRRLPTIFTTPPAPQFQALLDEMRNQGCAFAVVEASSHGLHQKRIAAFRVAVAGFSNLTRDHLDYHGTMEAYEDAKRLLFSELAERACFNVDDATGAKLAAEFVGPKITVSAHGGDADLSAVEARFDLDGCVATVADRTDPARAGDRFTLSIPLIGSHNLQNALLALGMAMLAGIPRATAVEALKTALGAPGRLQPVTVGSGPKVFVDYAHSPDALENVLSALRKVIGASASKLVTVFGAGGDRDKGKRPQMAEVAARLSDRVVATSDNPRTEDPDAILDDIAVGFAPGFDYLREVDRKKAITRAILEAGDADVVLVAGKGHEDYQIIGTTKHPFDDVAVARDALLQRTGGGAR